MKCWQCGNEVPECEIYTDFYYCDHCTSDIFIQPERLNPETLDKGKDDEMGKYYLSQIPIVEMR